MLISFIIPCYNGEKFIAECLNSLYNQDISEEEYEVICVNDCTPDNMRNILVEYQQKHHNLRIIDHTENKWQSGARNTGLKAACGEYVWFIDQDDTIKINVLKHLLGLCKNQTYEMVLFNNDFIDENNRYIETNDVISKFNNPKLNIKSGSEFLVEDIYIWNRIYLRNFLINNNLFFPEIPLCEDTVFTYFVNCYLSSIFTINESLYYNRIHFMSCSAQFFANDYILKGDLIFNLSFPPGNALVKFSQDIQNSEYVNSQLLRELGIWRINSFIKPLIKTSLIEKRLFKRLLKNNAKDIKDALPYLNKLNRLIINYPVLLFILNPFVQTLLIIKKWKD